MCANINMLAFSLWVYESTYVIKFFFVFIPSQEIVPARLMTSPIPSEDALSKSRDSRGLGSVAEDSQPLSTDDPAFGMCQNSSNPAVKKRKRRRKKHKGDPRREEQAAPGGAEVELCELSSDEENIGQWFVKTPSLKVYIYL